MKQLLFAFTLLILSSSLQAQQKTYCNPINVDYAYLPIPNFSEWGKHRSTADPVIVLYKGDYYLFSTNQWGYWWSSDMLNWNFVSKSFLTPELTKKYPNLYDDLCAPAVWVQGDTLLVFGSTYGSEFPIWMSTDPKSNKWEKAIPNLEIGGWDPGFFVDDDGRLYMYNGSSNVYPLYGIELDRKTFQPIGTRKEMLLKNDERFGWHRFGEYMDNTFLSGFMEGTWVTKHNGKYYLQWGGPGTEFSGYADGVAVANSPLGHFEHVSMPMSYKPGGFARGAGHGATYQDKWNNYWHVSTIAISVKNNFERRIGIWPAGFDSEDNMYCNTVFGDYPHYLPTGPADHLKSQFSGWMLLNYKKPVQVSSSLSGHNANDAVDENIKTYWSAATGNKGEWLQTDLGDICTINAIQINYADQDAEFLGKQTDIYHQYKLYSSNDGKNWKVLVDKSQNKKDVPHDYIELENPIKTRFIKMENLHMASGKFAVSGLRIFGLGSGSKPGPVKDFMVLRTEADKRSAWIKWQPVTEAYAYNIYTGIEPDKLYNCIMVHDANEYYFKAMDRTKTYYFSIESINENGVSERSKVYEVK